MKLNEDRNFRIKLDFKKYQINYFNNCMKLFESNCPSSFAEEERADYIYYLQNCRDHYLLGFTDNNLISTVGIAIHSSVLASLRWIMVHPDYHSKGCGRQLMDYVKNYVAGNGIQKLSISTSQHANNFFEKCGARELNFINDGWGKGMHKIDMEISLNN